MMIQGSIELEFSPGMEVRQEGKNVTIAFQGLSPNGELPNMWSWAEIPGISAHSCQQYPRNLQRALLASNYTLS